MENTQCNAIESKLNYILYDVLAIFSLNFFFFVLIKLCYIIVNKLLNTDILLLLFHANECNL